MLLTLLQQENVTVQNVHHLQLLVLIGVWSLWQRQAVLYFFLKRLEKNASYALKA
jgi:hypothetical protein